MIAIRELLCLRVLTSWGLVVLGVLFVLVFGLGGFFVSEVLSFRVFGVPEFSVLPEFLFFWFWFLVLCG